MTMKIRGSIIWFVVVVAGLIMLVLWLGKKPVQTPLSVVVATNAAPPTASTPTVPSNVYIHTNAPSAQVASSSTPAAIRTLPQDKVGVLKEILQANDADIVFYGRLEDQFGNAVGNTPVNFAVRYENLNGRGVQRGQVVADGNGLFKISGYKGQDISVIPEKAGYIPLEIKGIGNYSPVLYPEDQRAHPDPNNPILIKMWKLQGGEHLIHLQTEIHVPIDGTPINLDLQTGQISGGGDLIVQVKTVPAPNVRQRYDWQATIQSINGGLISSSEEFEQMLQAPDTGYNSKFDIAYQKDVIPWSTTFNGGFYFSSRNGGCYGKLGIEILSDVVKNGTVPVILNSYVNPSGSRNLEIDPKLVTEAHP
jgi:hypothetical protein